MFVALYPHPEWMLFVSVCCWCPQFGGQGRGGVGMGCLKLRNVRGLRPCSMLRCYNNARCTWYKCCCSSIVAAVIFSVRRGERRNGQKPEQRTNERWSIARKKDTNPQSLVGVISTWLSEARSIDQSKHSSWVPRDKKSTQHKIIRDLRVVKSMCLAYTIIAIYCPLQIRAWCSYYFPGGHMI